MTEEPSHLTPELLALIRTTTVDRLRRLRAALDRADAHAAARDAHFILGGLALLDDPQPAALAQRLEQALQDGDVAAARGPLEALEEAVRRRLPGPAEP